MIQFYPESKVRVVCPRWRKSKKGPKYGIYPSGWFAVRHKKDKDRLILDRRPRNPFDRRFRWCCLPHGTQLCQKVLKSKRTMRGSLDDLRNYFYSLKQGPGAELRNPWVAGSKVPKSIQ